MCGLQNRADVSEHVVRWVDEFEDDRFYFLVSEYAGSELFKSLSEDYEQQRIDERIVRSILRQVVTVVEFCHSIGVAIHDISLENICINAIHEIKLIDFGLARIYNTASPIYDVEGNVPGKPMYICPEGRKGVPFNAFSADCFAIGVLVCILLTGQSPFPNERSFERICSKGLHECTLLPGSQSEVDL